MDLAPIVALAVAIPPGSFASYKAWRRVSFPRRATRTLSKLWDPTQKRDEQPKLRAFRPGVHTWTLAWKMPTGASTEKWQGLIDDIGEDLNCSVVVWYDGGKTWMRLGVKRMPKRVTYAEFYRAKRPAGQLVVGVGESHEGKIWFDFAELPHLLVAGMNNSGKSRALAQMIVFIAETYSPQQVRMLLIDLKGKGAPEFSRYAGLPHLDAPIIGDLESCKKALAQLESEMNERYLFITASGCTDLNEYNQRHPEAPLPRKLVVVDESADLIQALTQAEQKAFERLVRELRGCGVHLVLATQRPDANVVPGQIRNNMGAILGFRVGNRTTSEVVLGDGHAAAASLPPHQPGLGIWQYGKGLELRVRGIFLSPAEAEERVRLLSRLPVFSSLSPQRGEERELPVLEAPELAAVGDSSPLTAAWHNVLARAGVSTRW